MFYMIPFSSQRIAAFSYLATFMLTSILFFSCCNKSYGQNTSIAYAYPIDPIAIDGDLSDWPKQLTQYPIQEHLLPSRPDNEDDFTAHFRIGYNLDNQSLYLALEVIDDDYIRDTTENVAWNSQDGHELYIDALHAAMGSGVVSYLYSKDLQHINKMVSDSVVAKAGWEHIEVATRRQGTTTVYEWRIALGDQLYAGRSIGVDHQVFDKDIAGDFTIEAWGKGGYKFMNPQNVGDVILMKAHEQPGTLKGRIQWKNGLKKKLPSKIRLTSQQLPSLWVDTHLDSLGQYTVQLPAGTYQVSVPDILYIDEEDMYRVDTNILATVRLQSRQTVEAPLCEITHIIKPDLIPEKGILHDFDKRKAQALDHFIETYRQYYNIPGVSLALIREGQLAYHKTYGVKNTFTQEAVAENTLFEAASITKTVFAYVVNRLAEKGIIDLDKPLYQYLPFEAIAHDDRYQLITAQHVLSHRTGFPNWAYMNEDGNIDIKFTPGTQYGYSGEGFEYLKRVVVHVMGKPVEQILQEEVMGLMGMYHTYFSKNEALVKMAAHGHYDNLPNTPDIPEQPGMAFSMYTEAKAFTQFMIGLLHEKGMQPTTYAHMFTLHSEYPYEEGEEKPKYKEGMGLGIALRDSPYGKVFGHGGNNGDFQCQFEVYQDLKMGYVVFTNSNMGHILCHDLKDFLMEGKKQE